MIFYSWQENTSSYVHLQPQLVDDIIDAHSFLEAMKHIAPFSSPSTGVFDEFEFSSDDEDKPPSDNQKNPFALYASASFLQLEKGNYVRSCIEQICHTLCHENFVFAARFADSYFILQQMLPKLKSFLLTNIECFSGEECSLLPLVLLQEVFASDFLQMDCEFTRYQVQELFLVINTTGHS